MGRCWGSDTTQALLTPLPVCFPQILTPEPVLSVRETRMKLASTEDENILLKFTLVSPKAGG